MTGKHLLTRITTNPEIFSGRPIIRGMRISVEMIVSLLAQGATAQELLGDYPDLEADDIQACLDSSGESKMNQCNQPGRVPHGRS